jgi:SlyX protein
MMEERLNEIEAKLAFAEDLVETLNQTVIRQQEQIDLMQQQLRLLHLQLQQVMPNESPSLHDEVPPHY